MGRRWIGRVALMASMALNLALPAAAGANDPLAITSPATLPAATVGEAYSATLTAGDGLPPYTWSSTGLSGTGLSLSTSGVLSGTASGPAGAELGFTAEVEDSAHTTATANLTLPEVAPSVQNVTIQVSPATALAAGVTYTVHFTTSGIGALSSGGTITLSAPSGPSETTFSAQAGDYTVEAGSSPAPVAVSGVTVHSWSPNDATITLGGGIAAATPVTVTAQNAGNPTAPSTGNTMGVATSADSQTAQSGPYAITAIPALPAGLADSTITTNPAAIYFTGNASPALTLAVAVKLKDGSGLALANRDVTLRQSLSSMPSQDAWAFTSPVSTLTNSAGDADFQLQCNQDSGGYCYPGPLLLAATDTTDGVVIGPASVPIQSYNIGFGGQEYAGGTADLSGDGLPANQAVTGATFNGSTITLSGDCATAANGGLGVDGTCAFTVPAGTAGTNYPVSLTIDGIPFQASFAMSTNPGGVAAAVTVAAGGNQSATVGTAFATDLQATVTDANGKDVSGVAVTFTAPASGSGNPGGTFAGGATTATAQTDSGGVAQAPAFTANTTAGSYTVTASAVEAGSATFTLTNTAGAGASIQATAGGQQPAVVGTSFYLDAKVLDTYGNAVPNASVTFTPPTSGAGTVEGAETAQTGNDGVATVKFTANSTIGQFQINATLPGVTAPAVFARTNASALLSSCDPATFASAIAGTAPVWLIFPPNCTITPTQTIQIQPGAQVTLDGEADGVTLQGPIASLGLSAVNAEVCQRVYPDGYSGRLFAVEGGSLTLRNVEVTMGTVCGADGAPGTNGGPGQDGGAAQGGAMYIAAGGKVTLVGGLFAANQAFGGPGGNGASADTNAGPSGGAGGAAQGGAIYNLGTLNIQGTTFDENRAEGGEGGNGGTGGVATSPDQPIYSATGAIAYELQHITGEPGGNGGAGGAAQGGNVYNAGSLMVDQGSFASGVAGGVADGGIGGTGGKAGDFQGSGLTVFAAGEGGQGGSGGAAQGGAVYNAAGGSAQVSNQIVGLYSPQAAGGAGGLGGTGSDQTGMSLGGAVAGGPGGYGGPGGTGAGGVFYNAGMLNITGSTIPVSAAGWGDGGGGGGGGLATTSNVPVEVWNAGKVGRSAVGSVPMKAQGGAGGPGGNGGDAMGGAIANTGTLLVSDSTIAGTTVNFPSVHGGWAGGVGYSGQGFNGLGPKGQPGWDGRAYGGALYTTGSATLNNVTFGPGYFTIKGEDTYGGIVYDTGTVRQSAVTYNPTAVTLEPDPGGAASGANVYPGSTPAPLVLPQGQLVSGRGGDSYDDFLLTSTAGGVMPYSWSASGLPPGLRMDPNTGAITGTPTAAGPFFFTVQVQDNWQPVPDSAGETLFIDVVPSAQNTGGVWGAGQATASAPAGGGTATAGGANSPTPDTTATASGGTGNVATTEYTGDPGPLTAFDAGGQYFDTTVSPGNTFTDITITECGVLSGATLQWLDGSTWEPVSPAAIYNPGTGCLTFSATATSAPSIAQLTGTVFGAGYTPSMVSSVSFTPSSLVGGQSATWTAAFTTSAGGALTAGQAVSLSAPDGTILPRDAGDYTVNGTVAAAVYGGNGNSIEVLTPATIGDTTAVTVVAHGVTNPAAGTYPAGDFTVATAADTAAASPANGITFTGSAASTGHTATAALTPRVSASDQGQAGLGVDVTGIQDSSGQDAAGEGIGGYQLTLTYDASSVVALDVYCPAPFSGCQAKTDQNTGLVTVQAIATTPAPPPAELAFAALRLTEPVTQTTTVGFSFQQLADQNGSTLLGPASSSSFVLQRGAVYNACTNGTPVTGPRSLTVGDAVAGLQYLVKLRYAGTGCGQVNPVALASLVPVGSGPGSTPSVADVVTLLQYLVGLRGADMNFKTAT